MCSKIFIYSQNVSGLGNRLKRRTLFRNFHSMSNSIFLLQETHSCQATEKLWLTEWGGQGLFGHGTSSSKGVAFLFPRNFAGKINETYMDPTGRIIIVNIDIEKENFTLVNIYSPTQNETQQQIQIIDILETKIGMFRTDNIIIGGDFNLHLNPELDAISFKPSPNKVYRQNLIAFLESNDLTDIWRVYNPEKQVFTWRRGTLKSRLDYFFVSQHLLNSTKCEILPGLLSDHCLLRLVHTQNNEQLRGTGLWKFNSRLLEDEYYINLMKE